MKRRNWFLALFAPQVVGQDLILAAILLCGAVLALHDMCQVQP